MKHYNEPDYNFNQENLDPLKLILILFIAVITIAIAVN